MRKAVFFVGGLLCFGGLAILIVSALVIILSALPWWAGLGIASFILGAVLLGSQAEHPWGLR